MCGVMWKCDHLLNRVDENEDSKQENKQTSKQKQVQQKQLNH